MQPKLSPSLKKVTKKLDHGKGRTALTTTGYGSNFETTFQTAFI
jgi:hypothetical protein